MAIEKDPAARFQTAEAFRAALGHAFPEAVAATKTLPLPVPIPTAAQAGIPTASSSSIGMPPPLSLPPTAPMTAAGAAAPPAAAPWVVPEPAPRRRRGLYMALGSIVTLAVLVGAVIEGPKLMRGGKSDAQGATASQQAVATTAPVTAAPAAVPDAGPVAAPVPAQDAGPVATPVAAAPAPAPEQPFRPIPRAASSPQNSAPPQQVAQAVPFQQAQQAAPQQAAQPVTAATASPELKELRDKINRVSVRGGGGAGGGAVDRAGIWSGKGWGCGGILRRLRSGWIMC